MLSNAGGDRHQWGSAVLLNPVLRNPEADPFNPWHALLMATAQHPSILSAPARPDPPLGTLPYPNPLCDCNTLILRSSASSARAICAGVAS